MAHTLGKQGSTRIDEGLLRRFWYTLGETFADPTYRTYVVLGLNQVLNTVVVDEKGIVRKVWRGELNTAKWRQVFNELGISTDLLPS